MDVEVDHETDAPYDPDERYQVWLLLLSLLSLGIIIKHT